MAEDTPKLRLIVNNPHVHKERNDSSRNYLTLLEPSQPPARTIREASLTEIACRYLNDYRDRLMARGKKLRADFAREEIEALQSRFQVVTSNSPFIAFTETYEERGKRTERLIYLRKPDEASLYPLEGVRYNALSRFGIQLLLPLVEPGLAAQYHAVARFIMLGNVGKMLKTGSNSQVLASVSACQIDLWPRNEANEEIIKGFRYYTEPSVTLPIK